MSARVATFLVFLINGAMIGTWIAHIPWIARQLDSTKTEVGIALLAASAGAVVSMTVTGQLLTRIPSRRMVVALVLVFPLAAPIPVVAPSLAWLVVGMLVFGALNGVLDVSMNAHGVAIEKAMRRPIISSLHAGWSLGGLLGAAAVALAAAVGLDPRLQTVVAAIVLLAIGVIAIPFLGSGSDGTRSPEERSGRLSLPSRAVLPIGLLGIVAALIEGGIGDWFGLYLERDVGMDPGLAALGFAAFALGMTVGRFSGDRVNRRFGAGRLLRAGMALTAVSLGLALAADQAIVALVGVAIAGVGVANAIPLVFSAGGHIPPSGPSLAAVFTMCYTAFLAGPPIIGFIADRIGLTQTLAMLVAVAVAAALVAPRVPGIDAASQPTDPAPGTPLPVPARR